MARSRKSKKKGGARGGAIATASDAGHHAVHKRDGTAASHANAADKLRDRTAGSDADRLARPHIKHDNDIAAVTNEGKLEPTIAEDGRNTSTMAKSGRKARQPQGAETVEDAAKAADANKTTGLQVKCEDTAGAQDADATARPDQLVDTATISDADLLAGQNTYNVNVDIAEPTFEEDCTEKPKQYLDPQTAFAEALREWHLKQHAAKPLKKRLSKFLSGGDFANSAILYKAEVEVTGYKSMARDIEGTKEEILELLVDLDGRGFLKSVTVVKGEDGLDFGKNKESVFLQAVPLTTMVMENSFMDDTWFEVICTLLSPTDLIKLALNFLKKSLQKLAIEFDLNYSPSKKYDHGFLNSLSYQELYLLAKHMGMFEEVQKTTRQTQDHHRKFMALRNKVISALTAKGQIGEMGEHGRVKQELKDLVQTALRNFERRRSGSQASTSSKVRDIATDDERCRSASATADEEGASDNEPGTYSQPFWQAKRREVEMERALGDQAIIAGFHEVVTKFLGEDETLEFVECRNLFLQQCQELGLNVIDLCNILRKEIIPDVDELV